ncbi:uncharacterized protein LOC135493396 isoform X2 [Lineus longissimus]|uniref:uncharacterized protein LOC135493396 isoform X2 n=1 Tax=Lineus longissimus TaxID=88925 RepID=UPI00315CFF21
MDKEKIKAMIEWVNALNVCEIPVTSLKDFHDGKNFLRVLKAVCKEDRESETDTALGRFCIIEEFLQGFYQSSEALSENVDLESVTHGNEIETAKVLVLLLAAAVQNQDREHFVETAMSLSLGLQAEIKELLEPLLMTEGQTVPRVPEDLSTILMMKRKSEHSPTRHQRSVVRALMQSPGVAGCFTNSPLTPIKVLIQSPQMAYKLRIRETEKKNKNLEKDLSEERHLKSELEWVLQEKKNEIKNQEKKIRDLERKAQEHKHFLDQLDEMGILKEDKDRLEAECSRLRTKLQEYQHSRQMLTRVEAENKELYTTVHDLKNQLKARDSAKGESVSLKARNRYLEEKNVEQELELSRVTDLKNQVTELLKNERAELEKVREINREKIKEMREQFEMKEANGPCGETMAVVTQKKVFELESEIMELRSNLIDPIVHKKLEEKLKLVNEGKQNAESALVDSKSKILSLEAQLSTIQSHCTENQEQIDNLTLAKRAVSDRADAQEGLILRLKEQEAKLVQTQKSLETEKGRLKDSCDSLEAELSSVCDALKLVTKERDCEQSNCETLRETLRKTLEDSQEKRKSLEKNHHEAEDKMNAKIQQLQSELLSIQEKKYSVEQELSDKLTTESEVSKKLERNVEELAVQFQDICFQRSKLLNEVDELKQEKAKEEEANVCLGKELAAVKVDLGVANEEREKFQSSLQEVGLLKSNLESKLEMVEGELEQEQKYTSELRERLSTLQADVSESEKEKNNLAVRIEQATADMASLRTEKVELELEFRQAHDTTVKLKDRLSSQKESMRNREEEFKKDLMGYETAISQIKSSFEKEIQSMKKCHDDLYEERRMEVEGYKSEMAEVQDKLVISEKRNSLLDEKWTEALNMVAKLETDIEESQMEYAKQLEAKEREIVGQKARVTEIETVMGESVSNLELKLKNLELDSSKRVAELEEKLSVAETEMEKVEEDLEVATKDAESITRKKDDLEQMLKTLEADSSVKVAELVEKLNMADTEIARMRDEHEVAIAEVETAKDSLVQMLKRLESISAVKVAELEEKVSMADREIEDLKEQHVVTVTEAEGVLKQKDDLEQMLKNLEYESSERVAEIEEKLNNAVTDMEQLKEQHQLSITEVEAVIREKESIIDEEKARSSQLQEEVENFRTQLMQISHQTDDLKQIMSVSETTLAEIRDELEDKKKTIASQDAEICEEKRRCSDLEKELSDVKNEMTEQVYVKDIEVANEKVRCLHLTEDMEKIQSELDVAEQDILSKEQRCQEVEEYLQTVEKKLVRVEEEMSGKETVASEQIRQLQQSLQAVESGSEESMKHVVELQQARTNLEQTVADLRQQMADAVEEAKSSIEDREEQIQKMQSDIELKDVAFTEMVEAKQGAEVRFAVEIEELKIKADADVAGLEKKLEEVQCVLESKIAELGEVRSTQEQAEVQMETLRKELVELQTKSEEKISELEQKEEEQNVHFNEQTLKEKELKDAYDVAEGTVAELKEKLAKVADEMVAADAREKDLIEKFSQEEEEREAQGEEVEVLMQQIGKLRMEVETGEAAIIKKDTCLAEKLKELEILSSRRQELEEALVEKDKRIELFVEESEAKEKELMKEKVELESAVSDLKMALQSVVASQEEELKVKCEEVKGLMQKINDLDEAFEEQKNKVEVLETDIEDKDEEIEKIELNAYEIQETMDEQSLEIEELKETITSNLTGKLLNEQALTEMKQRLAETEERESAAKDDLEKQLHLLCEKERELTELNSQLESVKLEYSAVELQKKQEEANFEKKVAALESTVQEQQETFAKKEAEVEKKVAELESSHEEHQKLVAEKEELANKELESKTQLQTRVLQLQLDHECARKQYAEVQQACSKSQEREEGFSSEIQGNKLKLEAIKKQMNQHELKVEQLTKLNAILEKNKASLAAELSQSKDRIKQVEEQYEEKIDMIQESVKEQMSSERGLFQERIQELESELKEKQEENQENENMLLKRNHEKDKLALELQLIQKKLESADVKYENLEKKYKTQIEREQKLILNKEHEIRLAADLNRSLRSQLEKEQEKNNSEMDELMKQAECISTEKNSIADENTQLTTVLRKEKEAVTELEKKTEKLNEYISKLKTERKKLIEEQEKSHSMYDKEIHRLQDELERESDLKEKFLHRYQKEEGETKELRALLSVAEARLTGMNSPSRSVLKSPNGTFKSPEISAIKSMGKSPRHFDDSLDFMDDSLEFEELTGNHIDLGMKPRHHDKENQSPRSHNSLSLSLRSSMTSMSGHNYFSPRSGRHRSPSLKSLGGNTTLGASLHVPYEPDPGFETEWDRLSELKRRNTLCLPHMRSSYPVETQAREPKKMAEDLMKSLPIPTESCSKYDQSTRRRMSPSELSDDLMKTTDLTDTASSSASIYNSCHRTLPSSFKVPQSVPIKADHKATKSSDKQMKKPSTSIFSSHKSSTTPQKESRRTPHKKHHKTPGSSKKSKGMKQALIDENIQKTDDRRESLAFSIPITPNKKKSKGLAKKFSSDKKEPQSPKMRKPLHARNFLLFGQ